MADSAAYDANLKPTLIAVSNADGVSPVKLWADPTTHLLQVSGGGGGGGGGTQYVDGVAQPTHPTGNALVYGNGANMTAVSSTTPLPVSGTFWQTTQPVSIATMPSTPVTGTFWQATQPVSGTVTSNISGSISNTSFNATTPLTTQTIGQTTSNTTQVQLTASSIVPSNGVTIQALSTNTASIFVGITGVLTTTGFELQAGQQMQFAPTNANLMYIIGANATDKVCYLIS